MSTPALTQRRISDVLVVVLAVVSVVLLVLSAFGTFTPREQLTVFWIDVGICVLFALEFLFSWSHLHWRPAFFLRNWYDVVGMIPVAHPIFLDGGWTRVLWAVVVLARIGRAVDRLVGQRVTASVTKRASAALVDAVKHPITVAVLEEVASVLQTGQYTKNIATALEENREEIKNMVREKLEEDRLTSRLTAVPFSDRLVDTVSETTLRVIFSVLDDPRTDELISDVLRENILQVRTEVHERAYGDGRGAAAWTPAGADSSSLRSNAASSAGRTAAVSAQASGVGLPDAAGVGNAAGGPGSAAGGRGTAAGSEVPGDRGSASGGVGNPAASAGNPAGGVGTEGSATSQRYRPGSNGVPDSTRSPNAPDPLARWRRPPAT